MSDNEQPIRRRPLPRKSDDERPSRTKKPAKAKEFKNGDRVVFTRMWSGELEMFAGYIASIDGRYDNVFQDNLKVVRNARVQTDEGALIVVPVDELAHE